MKLDKDLVFEIVSCLDGWAGISARQIIRERLESLDLVFKPGDALQSILVENRTNTNEYGKAIDKNAEPPPPPPPPPVREIKEGWSVSPPPRPGPKIGWFKRFKERKDK